MSALPSPWDILLMCLWSAELGMLFGALEPVLEPQHSVIPGGVNLPFGWCQPTTVLHGADCLTCRISESRSGTPLGGFEHVN